MRGEPRCRVSGAGAGLWSGITPGVRVWAGMRGAGTPAAGTEHPRPRRASCRAFPPPRGRAGGYRGGGWIGRTGAAVVRPCPGDPGPVVAPCRYSAVLGCLHQKAAAVRLPGRWVCCGADGCFTRSVMTKCNKKRCSGMCCIMGRAAHEIPSCVKRKYRVMWCYELVWASQIYNSCLTWLRALRLLNKNTAEALGVGIPFKKINVIAVDRITVCW